MRTHLMSFNDIILEIYGYLGGLHLNKNRKIKIFIAKPIETLCKAK